MHVHIFLSANVAVCIRKLYRCNVAEKMSLIQIKAGMAELFGLLAQARANQAGPLAGWLAGMQTGKHHVTRIPKSSTWIFYIFHALSLIHI